jgi:hypothetical protein
MQIIFDDATALMRAHALKSIAAHAKTKHDTYRRFLKEGKCLLLINKKMIFSYKIKDRGTYGAEVP